MLSSILTMPHQSIVKFRANKMQTTTIIFNTDFSCDNLKRTNVLYFNIYILMTEKHMHATNLYRVSQEECARLREGVPYVKVYRYNPKHLCPKLNGYGDNGQRKVWSSGGSTHCTCQLTVLSMSDLECGVI